jgi:hypothetical protein
MRAISVALPALTWKSVRNAARAALVFSDILLVMIAASNRESFRIKDFSGLQEGSLYSPIIFTNTLFFLLPSNSP